MKKLLTILLFIAISMSFGSNVCLAETDSEIARKIENRLTFLESYVNIDVNEDLKAEVELLKPEVNTISDYNLKVSLMEKVNSLLARIEDILSGEDIDDLLKQIKIIFEDNDLKLSVPKSSRYYYNILVENADLGVNMLKAEKTSGGKYILPTMNKATKIVYTVKIYEKSDKLLKEKSETYNFKDTTAPKAAAIYVLNDKLYVEATDNYKLANEAFSYIVDDKTTESDSYYKIKKYPTVVKVRIKDHFGNVSSLYTVNVNANNKVYYGKVSDSVLEDINEETEASIKRSRHFKNIVIGELGKEIDYFDAFEDYFEDKFEDYEEDEISIYKSALTKSKTKNRLILNKKGIFEVIFKNEEDERVYTYVIVGDEDGEIEKYYNYVTSDIPTYVTKSRMTFSEYINYFKNYKYTDKEISNKYIVIIFEDRLYSLSTSISLEDNKRYNIKVYDIANDMVIDNEVLCRIPVTRTETLTDIRNHWAYSSIVNMVKKNVITGYPDYTFRPDAEITVRDFIVMMNRISPLTKRATVNPYDIGLPYTDWAYYEVKNVLSKISYEQLYSSGILSKFDYPITREEVAFLVSNFYNLQPKQTNKIFVDAVYSTYPNELQNAISNGILTGYKDNTIRPFNFLTRAEAVTVLNRIK